MQRLSETRSPAMSVAAVPVPSSLEARESQKELTAAQLAEESNRKEGKTWLPAIPLTILAPILVALALVGVLLPNTYILTNASDTSTSYLAGKYLSLLMEDVKARIEHPIDALVPVAQALANSPDMYRTMTGDLTRLQYSDSISTMAVIRDTYNLDVLLCVTASWKSPYDATYPPNTTYALQSWIYVAQVKNMTVALTMDETLPNYMKGWALDPITRKVANPTTPIPGLLQPVNTTLSETSQMQVGTVPAVRTPYFRVNRQNSGLNAGLVVQQRFVPATATLPKYACAVGFQTDSVYNDMLRKVKPMNSSVIAMFELGNFRVLASSNMVMAGTSNAIDSSGNIAWANAVPDALTVELQSKLRERFNGDTSLAVAAATSTPSFEMELSGSRWIINIAAPTLSATDTLILVAAVPRVEIYGVIESARVRSRGISAGISVAAAILVAAIFVLAVLPLATLAKQMEQLTKLDFGTLESSGALETRSAIWELRQVQIVFATMVRAFAGAIKKNKAMMNKNANQSSSQLGATRSGGATGNANQSRAVLPVGVRQSNVA